MRKPIVLDLDRTALLLVDLQEEQRRDLNYAVAGIDGILANARRILLAARERKVPVLHAAYRRDFELCPPRPFEPLLQDGAPTFSDKASPLTAICAEVGPIASEPVIYKNDASAFCEGNLMPLLSERQTEWLIVAGVWTEACVAATVRDAMELGFRVLLVKDACGSATAAMHETGILNLANRLYGGGVADTERVLKLLAGGPAEVWSTERPAPILFDYDNAHVYFESL